MPGLFRALAAACIPVVHGGSKRQLRRHTEVHTYARSVLASPLRCSVGHLRQRASGTQGCIAVISSHTHPIRQMLRHSKVAWYKLRETGDSATQAMHELGCTSFNGNREPRDLFDGMERWGEFTSAGAAGGGGVYLPDNASGST